MVKYDINVKVYSIELIYVRKNRTVSYLSFYKRQTPVI